MSNSSIRAILIGPYRMPPLQARVDLGAMSVKEYSAFPKAPALHEPIIRLFSVISGHSLSGGPAEKQSVYSTAPADWASYLKRIILNLPIFPLPSHQLLSELIHSF